MGRDAMKAGENPCFRCRKEAAKYNDKLSSREGAAEMLGVSVSSLADYELGITKVIPVDKIVLMAELYNAPELKAWYCTSECPIGKSFPMPSSELSSVERTTLNLLRQLRQEDVEDVKEKLIDITADGVICRFIGGGIWELYRQHGINAASNSEGVCILKEAARRLVEREEATK